MKIARPLLSAVALLLLGAATAQAESPQPLQLAPTVDSAENASAFTIACPSLEIEQAILALVERAAMSCIPASKCCKICSTGKACGDSCISRRYTCRKGRGCACDAAEVCEFLDRSRQASAGTRLAPSSAPSRCFAPRVR